MLFDTHAHLNDERFDGDRDALIASFKDNGISYVCEIGFDIESSLKAKALSDRYDFIYTDFDTLENLMSYPKVVALGEIGLDYYYDNSDRSIQRKRFAEQLDLAKKIQCPVIIHTRDAMADTIDILKSHGSGEGIIHCYSGSCESAKILLDMGYYISFAGPVTFKNANSILDVIAYVPKDRMLIETDSPYLAPVPYRGKRNCPVYVAEVAKKIAQIKGMDYQEVAHITMQNAKQVYKIGDFDV